MAVVDGQILRTLPPDTSKLGGAELRGRLVRASGGKDLPIALLEDAIAIALSFWVVTRLR